MKPVVGAAIVRHGHVLAARRTSPPETAGRWEFPGGKVEAGESPAEAVVREISEELRCTVEVEDWLDGVVAIGERHQLRVALVRLVVGEPTPTEHDALRWLTPERLGDVDWLEPDRPFLSELRERLLDDEELPDLSGESGVPRVLGVDACDHGDTARMRGIFFDESDAETVVSRLTRDGWEASVVRERLAGEDDDEDHPWAVFTDAPDVIFEVLVEQHDGWLDAGHLVEPPTLAAPLDLPTGPKRIKREQG